MAGNASKAAVRGRLPVKRTINLAMAGLKPMNKKAAAIGVVLILIAAAAFGKFAVADRLSELHAARARRAELQAAVDEGYAEVESYGSLLDRYAHYTYSDMTAEELSAADRSEVLDLVARVVSPKADIAGWTLRDNQLTLEIGGCTADDVSGIVSALQADALVDFCTTTTAAMGGVTERDGAVSATILVYLNAATEEVDGQ